MSDLNTLTVVGRLTKDAEMKHVGNSDLVVFTIANNTGFGQYAYTNFFNVNAWGKQAQAVLPYLKKGKQVGVSGVFENRKWTDQQGMPRDGWTLTVQGTINMMADPKNTEDSQNTARRGSLQSEPNYNDYFTEGGQF